MQLNVPTPKPYIQIHIQFSRVPKTRTNALRWFFFQSQVFYVPPVRNPLKTTGNNCLADLWCALADAFSRTDIINYNFVRSSSSRTAHFAIVVVVAVERRLTSKYESAPQKDKSIAHTEMYVNHGIMWQIFTLRRAHSRNIICDIVESSLEKSIINARAHNNIIELGTPEI